MKPEDKKELIKTIKISKKVVGVLSILFTVITLLSDKEHFKTTFICTLFLYTMYVFIRLLHKKLS